MFGCGGEDSLEHYLHKPWFLDFLCAAPPAGLGVPRPNTPYNLLLLESSDPVVNARVAVGIYALYTLRNTQRHNPVMVPPPFHHWGPALRLLVEQGALRTKRRKLFLNPFKRERPPRSDPPPPPTPSSIGEAARQHLSQHLSLSYSQCLSSPCKRCRRAQCSMDAAAGSSGRQRKQRSDAGPYGGGRRGSSGSHIRDELAAQIRAAGAGG